MSTNRRYRKNNRVISSKTMQTSKKFSPTCASRMSNNDLLEDIDGPYSLPPLRSDACKAAYKLSSRDFFNSTFGLNDCRIHAYKKCIVCQTVRPQFTRWAKSPTTISATFGCFQVQPVSYCLPVMSAVLRSLWR